MSRRAKPRGGCDNCRMAGCLECKMDMGQVRHMGGRSGVYGGSFEGPTDHPGDSCNGCAPSTIVYFNLSLFNPSDATSSIPAQIVDTRSTNLIDDPDNWEMSVVRFDVSAQLLPPMVLPMVLPAPVPPTSPATVPTLLTVTLRSGGGTDFQRTVSIPYNGPATFGYVFSFSQLCASINAAFNSAFTAMGAPTTGALAPYLYFNPNTQMFQLFYQATVYGQGPGAVEIWVNAQTYKYIDSMPAFFAGLGQPNGKDYRLQVEIFSTAPVIVNAANTPVPPGNPLGVFPLGGGPSPAPQFVVAYITQAGPSLASTNGVRSVVLQSNLLPINPEGLPTTVAPTQGQGYSSNSTPIISDFLVSTDPANNPVVDRISISYLPTAEYRVIQLRGRSPIKQVDIKFFYTLFDGTVKELMLFPGGYCSVKLLFRRSARSTLKDSLAS